MAFKIGDPNHKTFPLANQEGRVTGLLSCPQVGARIDAAKLAGFEFLEEGKQTIVNKRSAIDVVDFGWTSYRGQEDHYLAVQHLEVEAGSVISGPIAWRTKGPVANPRKPRRVLPRRFLAASALLFLVPVGLEVSTALRGTAAPDPVQIVMSNSFWMLLAVVALTGELLNAKNIRAANQLSKNPSVRVHTPATRLWSC